MNSVLRLSVVVPTFNESGNVRELLSRLDRILGPAGWEIIFVDDDSPDGTANTVREIAKCDHRVRCLHRIGRRGLSTACIEGMLAASASVIAVMDADLQHDETILPKMLEAIEQGNAELAIGTRYVAGGGTGNWDESRKSMSRFATAASQAVLKQPISDPMSGFFLLHRKVLESTVHGLSGLGFKILLDILATSKHPLRVAEVPYTFRNRFAGESKLDEMVIWEYGMLLADKTVGKFIPVRLLTFLIVGGLGVVVNMTILTIAMAVLTGSFMVEKHQAFMTANAMAIGLTMIFNFALNNLLTYRDRRLRGWKWFKGLISFMLGCSIGGVVSFLIANYLNEHRNLVYLASLAGVMVGSIWNYAVTQIYTWGKVK
jgi:dolichol-phosphate mannosyltransferase